MRKKNKVVKKLLGEDALLQAERHAYKWLYPVEALSRDLFYMAIAYDHRLERLFKEERLFGYTFRIFDRKLARRESGGEGDGLIDKTFLMDDGYNPLIGAIEFSVIPDAIRSGDFQTIIRQCITAKMFYSVTNLRLSSRAGEDDYLVEKIVKDAKVRQQEKLSAHRWAASRKIITRLDDLIHTNYKDGDSLKKLARKIIVQLNREGKNNDKYRSPSEKTMVNYLRPKIETARMRLLAGKKSK